MGTKTIRLDDEIYERIKAEKRQDETFSEAIERLIGEVSLLELADGLRGDAETDVKAAIRRSRNADRRSWRDVGRPSAGRDA